MTDKPLKSSHWRRIDNGGLDFTEPGTGSAPFGDFYRAFGARINEWDLTP